MNSKHAILLGAVVVAALAIGQGTSAPGPINIAQQPLFTRASLPPLNMLVMGKDHKIYYEAYNDASDLTGDGVPDVGYKPAIDYYGYFNSHACYNWNGDYFTPASATADKRCGGSAWSGDFLNYLTTSRMDALRRVLYGGWRQTDGNAGLTILQGAFFPQDAHSWGKEYQSAARDGYNIADYAPLSEPAAGKYHLFAVTTTSDNMAPRFRVLRNSDFRVWNWLSIEGPVAGNNCFNSSNSRVSCLGGSASGWELVPSGALSALQLSTWKREGAPSAHPTTTAEMDAFFTTHATAAKLCGSGAVSQIDKPADGNPFTGNGCGNDHYLSRITGTLSVPVAGNYIFAVDGDDAVDFAIDGDVVASWYGGHGANRSDGGLTGRQVTVALAAGDHAISFRHQEGGGGDSWGLFWKNTASAVGRDEYLVRVQACPGTEALRDDSCRAYPNGHYKPTGILHDYGMTQRMYFGLITGTQANNLEGGVLRRNISDFAQEIDAQTGQIRNDVDGIIRTLDRLRMIGGGYNGGVTDNLNSDTNWNWANGTGNCPSIGDRAINNGECRMWANPIAEMLYEAMRYFAGAPAATSRFASGGASQGQTEEATMGLTTEAWKDPYKPTDQGGGGYPSCARPFQTIISDINPSYDGDLPGSAWGTAASGDSNPATLAGFSASTEGGAVWANEFGGSRSVFIGEVGGVTDGAPTAKTASSFANIRGLAPEEPTKMGTYYSASVARYARNQDVNAVAGEQSVITYSIALASPLPKIEFPVGVSTITLLPFAKTVSGTFGGSARKPTNTIVDFYVQRVANLPGQAQDASVNGGRPLAEFRINYEDVEQGNDHDMDAIVLYQVVANADNTVTVTLSSEYAAGSANQNIGYVISGSTQDGVYLGVRDRDSPQGTSVYEFNTPTGVYAGGCIGATGSAPCNEGLGFSAVHTFTPGDSPGTKLKDPLWYAAKHGGFEDSNNNDVPDLAPEWDADGDTTPDNYFLVTNPLNLRNQLSKAFDRISNQAGASGTVSLAGARVSGNSFIVVPSYNSLANGHDWFGNLTAYSVLSSGLPGAVRWHASAQMPDTTAEVDARKIYTALGAVNSTNRATQVQEFRAANLGSTNSDQFQRLGYTTADIINLFGGSITPRNLVDYLRGDKTKEGEALNTAPFRARTSILGDIISSSPVIASKRSDYGWALASGLPSAARSGYASYVAAKSGTGRKEYVYVGANDGMFHAFDGTNGNEVFAYIPNGVLHLTGQLADRNYGANPQKRYYVDGQIALGDAHDGGNWQTLAVGAAGAGGRTVFGLKVSSPTTFGASDVLWEVNSQTDTDIGHVMGKPVIVPLANGSWAAVFGNGYNSDSSDAVLFVVDIFTGQVIKKIVAPDGDNVNPNGLGNIAAVDTTGDGLIDTIYGGDLLGNVWKFDLAGTTTSSWGVAYGGTPMFVARDRDGNRQPITGGLEISVGPGLGYMVYFGTGTYFKMGDNNSASGQQVQSLYGVWDNGVTAITGARSGSLVEQQIIAQAGGARAITRNPVNYVSQRGWYLDLIVGTADTGERFIGTPRIQSGRILFDAYQPGITTECQPGGQNWRYGLNLLTGGAALGQVKTAGGQTIGGDSTGAVATTEGAPSRDVAVTQPPTAYPPLYCDPADASCTPPPPGAKCSEVIIDPNDPADSIIVQRACGRQSWRQLR
jgi:type IV pilus assembly protein PilY1